MAKVYFAPTQLHYKSRNDLLFVRQSFLHHPFVRMDMDHQTDAAHSLGDAVTFPGLVRQDLLGDGAAMASSHYSRKTFGNLLLKAPTFLKLPCQRLPKRGKLLFKWHSIVLSFLRTDVPPRRQYMAVLTYLI